MDDDDSHRQVIRAMLSPLGFEISDTGNAMTVPERVEQERPNLILLDVSMPGKSGWEVLAELREMKYNLPVVMVSADANEGHHSAEAPRLHDGYIIKPVRLNLLLDTIGRVMGLDWRFEKSPEPLAALPLPASGALELPAREHCEALADLARIGHRKGLLEALHSLQYAGDASDAFVQEITKFTNDFQFEKILELLEVAEHEAS